MASDSLGNQKAGTQLFDGWVGVNNIFF